MSFGEGDLHEQVDKLMDLNGVLCAEVREKDARIRELESELAKREDAHSAELTEREENCVANMRTVIKDHAEMNRFTRAQLVETEHVNAVLRYRIHILEPLVRDMWRTLSAMYRLNLGIDIGKERGYEERMSALGLLDGDAR